MNSSDKARTDYEGDSQDNIEVRFLCQGCQTANDAAQQLARFLNRATKTIDIDIYSFHLEAATQKIVLSALRERVAAGVAVRIAYDAGTQQPHIPGHETDPEAEQIRALRENPFALNSNHRHGGFCAGSRTAL